MQFPGFMWFSGWICKSTRYLLNFFTLVQQVPLKTCAINCSYFTTGAQKSMSRQRKKERTKKNHTWPHFLAIPNVLVLYLNLTYLIIILGLLLAFRKAIKFTCTITSVPSISRVAFTYMWSNGICATSIHMTRVISFTFVNIWEIKDERKTSHYRVSDYIP